MIRAAICFAAFVGAATLLTSDLSAQPLPAPPSPVAVTLTSGTTAVLSLDMIEPICNPQPRCLAMVPRVASLLSAARRAGALVVHSAADARGITAPISQPPFLAAVAPVQGEPVVIGGAQERFYGTLLDQLLRKRGITTLVLAGWRENGSVLYTAVAATLRGYTVVVADDATGASQDYDVAVGRYQLLTQLNANPQNEALRKSAVTLSRTDLISFR